MDYWFPSWDDDVIQSDEKKDTTYKSSCIHRWTPVLLLTSTVYDCSKFGVHREDYDKKD